MPSEISETELNRRRKISEARLGKPTWNKGLTLDKDSRLKGIAEGASRFHGGRKFTEEHKRNLSESHRNKVNWNYKGGIEPENKRIRKSVEYKIWRIKVFERDSYQCQKCKKKGNSIHPHHINNFSTHKELRFDENNGITLCEKDHREFHKIYGQCNNTAEQLKEFLNV